MQGYDIKIIDIKISFYSHANKTHFQKKDFAPRNSEKAYSDRYQ